MIFRRARQSLTSGAWCNEALCLLTPIPPAWGAQESRHVGQHGLDPPRGGIRMNPG